MIKLHWYCGCYVGAAHWQWKRDWVFEPDECTAEGEIVVDYEDWAEGIVAIECPECGAELAQFMCHFEEAKSEESISKS